MKQLTKINGQTRQQIVRALYKDEVYNISLIHPLENFPGQLGDLFINMENDELRSILHMKFDGNSNFTAFYVKNKSNLKDIANVLANSDKADILLAGKFDEIKQIQKLVNRSKDIQKHCFYIFSREKYRPGCFDPAAGLVKIRNCDEDIPELNEMLISFFRAETKDEIKKITGSEKIKTVIENGAFFLKINDKVAGMARFFGYSKNYIEITTVFIRESFRGQGLGKSLMRKMISEAESMNKIPALKADSDNTAACRLYEDAGFRKIGDYAFHFL